MIGRTYLVTVDGNRTLFSFDFSEDYKDLLIYKSINGGIPEMISTLALPEMSILENWFEYALVPHMNKLLPSAFENVPEVSATNPFNVSVFVERFANALMYYESRDSNGKLLKYGFKYIPKDPGSI